MSTKTMLVAKGTATGSGSFIVAPTDALLKDANGDLWSFGATPSFQGYGYPVRKNGLNASYGTAGMLMAINGKVWAYRGQWWQDNGTFWTSNSTSPV
jgi:hypothetical protein